MNEMNGRESFCGYNDDNIIMINKTIFSSPSLRIISCDQKKRSDLVDATVWHSRVVQFDNNDDYDEDDDESFKKDFTISKLNRNGSDNKILFAHYYTPCAMYVINCIHFGWCIQVDFIEIINEIHDDYT